MNETNVNNRADENDVTHKDGGKLQKCLNKQLWIVVISALLALPVTGYLIYMHYAPEASDFCEINDTLNCDIVNKSQWSYIDLGFVDVPVAIMGFVTYLIFFVVGIGLLRSWKFENVWKGLNRNVVIMLLRWLAVVGFLFSLYLTYIEAFVLQAWCVFCIAQQILIFIIMVMMLLTIKFTGKKGGGST